ncbi:MAG: DUF2853 family protein [Flavobacteriaceae bacterium]
MGNKKDELILKYSIHLREKFNLDVDADLLERLVHGLGPAIYNRDAATVSGSSESELVTVKNNFLIKKLGLEDSEELMVAINEVMKQYGRSERTKYRAVVYYMLVKAFGKEKVYD